MITPEQHAWLEHDLLDPDAWFEHVCKNFSEDDAWALLENKVARCRARCEAAMLADPAYVRKRAEREQD